MSELLHFTEVSPKYRVTIWSFDQLDVLFLL